MTGATGEQHSASLTQPDAGTDTEKQKEPPSLCLIPHHSLMRVLAKTAGEKFVSAKLVSAGERWSSARAYWHSLDYIHE
ncbi:uncharacterized [Tachysurus ichikawai]